MKRPRLKKRKTTTLCIFYAIICSLLLIIRCDCLWALYVELKPTFMWGLTYEDNVTVVSSQLQKQGFHKKPDFSNRYEPALEFNIEGSRVAIRGKTQVRVRRYFSLKDWDGTDKDYNIESIFKINPRSELSLGADYSLNTETDRYFTNEQGVPSGELVRKSQNITKAYTGTYSYMLSPKGTLGLIFSYLTFFTQGSSGSPLYSYNLIYNYILNTKDSLNVLLGYNNLQFNYTIAEELLNYERDTYIISAGLTHIFSDTFKLNFSAGINYSDTTSQKAIFKEDTETGEQVLAGTESVSNSTTGTNFNLELEKKYYHTTIRFTGAQSLYTDPETGQTYPTRRFGFNINYDFTEKLTGGLGWYFFNNKSSAGDYNNRVDIDRQSNYGTLRLEYRFKPNIKLSLGYSRAYSENKVATNNETTSNRIYLQCSFALQRPFIVR